MTELNKLPFLQPAVETNQFDSFLCLGALTAMPLGPK